MKGVFKIKFENFGSDNSPAFIVFIGLSWRPPLAPKTKNKTETKKTRADLLNAFKLVIVNWCWNLLYFINKSIWKPETSNKGQ